MDHSEPVRILCIWGSITDIIHAVSGEEHSIRDDPESPRIMVRTTWTAVKRIKSRVDHAVEESRIPEIGGSGQI